MPEPYFDEVAAAILHRLGERYALSSATMNADIQIIAEQLRLVWNARGLKEAGWRCATCDRWHALTDTHCPWDGTARPDA